MLTLFKPPSPASSVGPREVTVTLPYPPRASPRLAGPLSTVSPPETSSPTKPLDPPLSSKGISALERWLLERFKKTNRNQDLQPPNQPTTRSNRPINLGLNPQSRSRETHTKKGRPSMAAGQRARVSVLFTVDKTVVVYLTSHLSERSGKPSIGFVLLVYLFAPLFIAHYRLKEISRPPKRAIRTRTRPVMDKRLQAQKKRAPRVSF